jgi:hypothetical protein
MKATHQQHQHQDSQASNTKNLHKYTFVTESKRIMVIFIIQRIPILKIIKNKKHLNISQREIL